MRPAFPPLLLLVCACSPEPAYEERLALTAERRAGVYAVVLERAYRGEPAILLHRTQSLPPCKDTGDPYDLCWMDDLPEAFEEAVSDYLQINSISHYVDRRTASALRQVPALVPVISPFDACKGSPAVTVSQVGFNGTQDLAVVSYEVAVGVGPHPPCGYAWGETILLRRRGSGWTVVETSSQWLT